MPASPNESEIPAKSEDPGLLDALSEAVESGAGLPAVARAAARLLDASVALIDRSSAVIASAPPRPASAVGELRYRTASLPDPAIARMVTTLSSPPGSTSRSPAWES